MTRHNITCYKTLNFDAHLPFLPCGCTGTHRNPSAWQICQNKPGAAGHGVRWVCFSPTSFFFFIIFFRINKWSISKTAEKYTLFTPFYTFFVLKWFKVCPKCVKRVANSLIMQAHVATKFQVFCLAQDSSCIPPCVSWILPGYPGTTGNDPTDKCQASKVAKCDCGVASVASVGNLKETSPIGSEIWRQCHLTFFLLGQLN